MKIVCVSVNNFCALAIPTAIVIKNQSAQAKGMAALNACIIVISGYLRVKY